MRARSGGDVLEVEIEELTPHGRGAVSVVRLFGAGAATFVRDVCGADVPAGAPRLARLRIEGEDIDEALVCRLAEDRFELHLHGSPVLVDRVLRHGPLARDRRDLRARALVALADAPAESAARILLDQAEGALTRDLRSLVHASGPDRGRTIDALLARGSAARFALHPPEVVLAGPVNAGKSTLFNALLGESRAIVDPTPGTTRDVLRERALFGGWPVWLLDTAGDRDLGPERENVEREGQAHGLRARAAADLVLWLAPVSADPAAPPPSSRTVVVRTFADRADGAGLAKGAISALREPAGARARIAEIFRSTFGLPEDPWTSGAAVPFTDALAATIAGLRDLEAPALARRVEAIVAGELGDAFAPPRTCA